VRVQPSGHKTYLVLRKHMGRTERVKIGTPDHWTPATARKQAIQILRAMDTGSNPAEIKRKQRAEMTLAALWQDFDTRHLRFLRPDTVAEYRSIWSKYLEPWGGSRRLGEVTPGDVHSLILDVKRRVSEKCGPGRGAPMANRVRQVLSSLYSAARRLDVDVANPVAGVVYEKELPRERWLYPDELRRFLRAIEAHRRRDSAAMLELLLFTGARKANVGGMQWRHINLADAVWTIPSSEFKTGRPHAVHLAPAAMAILAERREVVGPRARYVFPAESRYGHLYNVSTPFATICRRAGLTDLRRTICARLTRSGCSIAAGRSKWSKRRSATSRWEVLRRGMRRCSSRRYAKR